MNTYEFLQIQKTEVENAETLLDFSLKTLGYPREVLDTKTRFTPSELYEQVIVRSLNFLYNSPNLFDPKVKLDQLYEHALTIEDKDKLLFNYVNHSLDIPRYMSLKENFQDTWYNTKYTSNITNNEYSIYQLVQFLMTYSLGEYNTLILDYLKEPDPSSNFNIYPTTYSSSRLASIKNILMAQDYQTNIQALVVLTLLNEVNKLTSTTIEWKFLLARILTILDLLIILKLKNPLVNSNKLLAAINLVVSPPEEYIIMEYKQIISLILIRCMEVSVIFSKLSKAVILSPAALLSSIFNNFTLDDYYESRSSLGVYSLKRKNTGAYSNTVTFFQNQVPDFMGDYFSTSFKLFAPQLAIGVNANPTSSINIENNLTSHYNKILELFNLDTLPTKLLQVLDYTHLNGELIRSLIINKQLILNKRKREQHRKISKEEKEFIPVEENNSFLLKRTQNTEDTNLSYYIRNNIIYGYRTGNGGSLQPYTYLSAASKNLLDEDRLIRVIPPLETGKELEGFPKDILILENFTVPLVYRLPMFFAYHNLLPGLLIPTHKDTINFILNLYINDRNDYSKYCSPLSECIRNPTLENLDLILKNMLLVIADRGYKHRDGDKSYLRHHIFCSEIIPNLGEYVDLRTFFNKKEQITTNATPHDMGIFIPFTLAHTNTMGALRHDEYLSYYHPSLYRLKDQNISTGVFLLNFYEWFERY